MYKTTRNIHLFLGLFAFAFLMMYGISAVQMAHNGWFKLKPSIKDWQVSIESSGGARAVAAELMQKHGVRGQINQIRETPPITRFRIVRPGTTYDVQFDPETRLARVRTNTAGLLGMLNRIHHQAGISHDYGLLNVWGWFVVAVSVALVLIALSGIYLWFRIHTERVAGAVLLLLSLGYSLPLIWMLRNP